MKNQLIFFVEFIAFIITIILYKLLLYILNSGNGGYDPFTLDKMPFPDKCTYYDTNG